MSNDVRDQFGRDQGHGFEIRLGTLLLQEGDHLVPQTRYLVYPCYHPRPPRLFKPTHLNEIPSAPAR